MGRYRQEIARATMIVALAVVTNKVLVFVLEILLAAWFGTTFVKDAYLVALVIPNLIFMVGIEAITVTFVPLLMGLFSKEKDEEVQSIVSSVVNVVVVSLSLISGLYIVLAPRIIPLIAPGFTPENLALAVRLTRILSPIIVWGGLIGLLVGILNSYKRFALAALRLAVHNLIVIGFVYYLRLRWGIFSLALAVSGASLLQIIPLSLGLWGKRGSYRLTMNIKHPEVMGMGMAMIPVVLGATLTQLNFLIERIMASGLSQGSISSLDFGYKLMRLPFEVFAVAIATVIFPSIAGLVIAQEGSRLREVFISAVRVTAFITLPAAVILMVLRVPLISMLFERGQFNAVSTRMTATALFYYSWGLFFHGVNYIAIRTYYAFKDYKTPLKMGLVTIGVYILLSAILVRYLAHGGLALGCSLAAMCYTAMLLGNLKTKIEDLQAHALLKPLVKIVAASALMAAAVIVVGRIPIYSPVLKPVLALGVGLLTFGVACFLLRIAEAAQVLKVSGELVKKIPLVRLTG